MHPQFCTEEYLCDRGSSDLASGVCPVKFYCPLKDVQESCTKEKEKLLMMKVVTQESDKSNSAKGEQLGVGEQLGEGEQILRFNITMDKFMCP